MAKDKDTKPGDVCPWEKDKEKNLRLWDSVCITDENKTRLKKVKYGAREFTAIDAQSQLRDATEIWGPYGEKWGIKECKWGLINDGVGNPIEITLDAVFCYPDGEFEISTDIKFVQGGECRKKCLTDLTTKALSKLGFNADVFLGLFDGDRHSNGDPPPSTQKPLQTQGKPTQSGLQIFITGVQGCKDLDKLKAYKKKCDVSLKKLSKGDWEKAKTAYEAHKKVLSQPLAQGAQTKPLAPTAAQSNKLFNEFVKMITGCANAEKLMVVMNQYTPIIKSELIASHQTVIDATYTAKMEEFKISNS